MLLHRSQSYILSETRILSMIKKSNPILAAGVPIDLMRRAVRTYGPVIGGGGFMPRASQMPGYSLLKNVNRW